MEIISNIHHACTLGSNHALFQLLRLIPSLLGMDDMVLGTRISPDMIHVENIESKNGDWRFCGNFPNIGIPKADESVQ